MTEFYIEDEYHLLSKALTMDEDYREKVTLKDGLKVLLRPVKPSDQLRIEEGMRQLSPSSRYMRFFTPRYQLTSEELRFFTHPDGVSHFAIVAMELDRNFDENRGIGIARFIRDRDNPTVAEMAITVIDEMQGRGIGQLLCRRIGQAADQRGVRKVQSLVLSENRKVINLIKKLYPQARFRAESEMMLIEIDLS